MKNTEILLSLFKDKLKEINHLKQVLEDNGLGIQANQLLAAEISPQNSFQQPTYNPYGQLFPNGLPRYPISCGANDNVAKGLAYPTEQPQYGYMQNPFENTFKLSEELIKENKPKPTKHRPEEEK